MDPTLLWLLKAALAILVAMWACIAIILIVVVIGGVIAVFKERSQRTEPRR